MKRSQRYSWCILFLIGLSTPVFSQSNFAYQASLDSVLQSGFYNISLSPAIIARCKYELDDLRIKDDAGNEIPYLSYTESARPNEEAFTDFPLTYSEDRKTIYINNILPNSLDKLFLLIKNSDAKRLATLSGSDDQMHWFVIKENLILQNEYTADSDAFVQSVSFPKSSYKYFRITMPGKNELPLNIIKAGVYRSSFTNNTYDTLPSSHTLQKDSSDKRSYLYMSFDQDYIIDNLTLAFSGSKFYKRPVAVYDKNTVNHLITADTISSMKPASFDFHIKTNRLLLVIDNKDNMPLRITKVTALQLHTSVTAYLEAHKRYTLYFGDSSALAPSYDLQYFDDSIGNNIFSLGVKNITAFTGNTSHQESKRDESKWILWSIILAVLASLIYFSLRMVREINNKKEGNADL